MRKSWYQSLACLAVLLINFVYSSAYCIEEEPEAQKAEWTILVYLNGNNNLDSFGYINLNQMEQIGSTRDVKVVVQWASLRKGTTNRVLVEKDSNETTVTSPIVQALGNVDMGDAKTLLEFIKWGVKKYPAKHYFVDVWNHGSGWHLNTINSNRPGFMLHPTDISWDDHTGHSISTKQLAEVMADSAKFIGRKIDLYASDACLMGMAEVANEMEGSVDTYAGSEEVEAALGWPYHKILERLVQNPSMSSEGLGTVLVEEMIKFYDAEGSNKQDATFSAYALRHMNLVNTSVVHLAADLLLVSDADKIKIVDAARKAQRFSYDDYADLTDLLAQLESTNLPSVRPETVAEVKEALSQFVVSHGATTSMPKAMGLAIWFPTSKYTYTAYSSRYSELKFDGQTRWGNTLKYLLN